MRYIAENLMKKEFEVLGVVFSVEDMEELDLDIVFDKEDIDEDYGTLVWDCGGGYISGEKVVDIIRKTLISKEFVNNESKMLFSTKNKLLNVFIS